MWGLWLCLGTYQLLRLLCIRLIVFQGTGFCCVRHVLVDHHGMAWPSGKLLACMASGAAELHCWQCQVPCADLILEDLILEEEELYMLWPANKL